MNKRVEFEHDTLRYEPYRALQSLTFNASDHGVTRNYPN